LNKIVGINPAPAARERFRRAVGTRVNRAAVTVEADDEEMRARGRGVAARKAGRRAAPAVTRR
jgi:hypothetical protein